MADNKGFMGRGFSFPFRVDPSTNRIAMSSAGQDVEEAIRIILRTNLGERVMLPEFGTAAGEFLFSDSRAERIAALEERIEKIKMQINANATNSVKLKELFEEQEKVQAQLDEKTERWVYLNEIAEKIGCV